MLSARRFHSRSRLPVLAVGRSGALLTICKIASSVTGPHSPSLHSTTQSPARGRLERGVHLDGVFHAQRAHESRFVREVCDLFS